MKRYALFFSDDHYPQGGWDDFSGAFTTIDDALMSLKGVLAQKRKMDGTWERVFRDMWAHIVDLHTCDIVWSDHTGLRRLKALDHTPSM